MKMTHLANPGRRRGTAVLIPLLAGLLLSAGALAQDRRAHPRVAPPHWQGDIHRFHERDWHTWRGGHWVHGPHGGRTGWWWVAGGLWYFYPGAVYPYPNPYEPPVLIPPPVDVLPPPTQYWYYCEASRTYYPYVPVCPGGWQKVPATPLTSPTP